MNRSIFAALLGCALIASPALVRAQANPPATEPVPAAPLPPGMMSIFDGKTLDGWIQEPLNAITLAGGDITNLDAFTKKLSDKSDPVSAFLSEQLDEASKTAMAASATPAPTTTAVRATRNALAKDITKVIAGSSIYDEARFKNVKLRPETQELLKSNPQGRNLARLNRVLLEDAYTDEIHQSLPAAWTVKDGALASLGAGRGVIYTANQYGKYRVIFDIRHVSGKPDHQAGVLVLCTNPVAGEKSLDALGGVQFQVPNGGTWDYRKGKNNAGVKLKDGSPDLFTRINKPDGSRYSFNIHEWSRCEILIDPSTGTARMAVAQPPGSKAVEILDFKDPTAGRTGPFALQMHNAGLFDEYANIAVEVDPKDNDLVTTK